MQWLGRRMKAKKDIKNKNFKVLLVYANTMMENLIPIHMSVLSAVLKQHGFDTKLFDSTYYRTADRSGDEVRVENLQLREFDLSKYGIKYTTTDIHEDFRETVLNYKPNIIGLTVVEDTYKIGLSLLKTVRDLGIPTLVGGVHAILSPEEVLAEDVVDMVCIGEGENAIVELCERMKKGEDYSHIDGIWVKKGKDIIKNPFSKLTDLNSLPYLDFSIYQPERIFRPMQGKVHKMLPIEVSRGCPYGCTYCAAPTLRQIYKNSGNSNYFRRKEIDKVIAEIEYYKKLYDMSYVYFTSESFLSMTDQEFDRFVSLYKKIKLPFWLQTRLETISRDRLRALEDVNCDRITVGIESGNEEVRTKVLNRKITNKQMLEAFNILSESSIPVSVNNIIGIPDETREEVFDTIELNRQIKADSISVFIFTPFRGSKLRQHCIEKGYISPDAFSSDLRIKSTLTMPTMTNDEIRGLLRTFPLYVKFPKEDYPKIKQAEKFDEKGNEIFKQLSLQYRQKYFS